jgi:hypothetical protein
MRLQTILIGGGCACVILLANLGAHAQTAKPLKLSEFSGYWSGTGVVTWTNGSSEQLKCVATYKNATIDLRQNLRCASPGYAISASVDLKVEGDSVSGSWEEKTYSANGVITGRVTETGLALAIKGPTFTADMSVNHSACKQTIEITPTGVDVSRISIGLGKC